MSCLYRSKTGFLGILFLMNYGFLYTSNCDAFFNPFEWLEAAQGIAEGVGKAVGAADALGTLVDFSDSIGAVNEFSNELGLTSEKSSDDEIKTYLDQVKHLEDALYEVGFAQDQVADFTVQVRRGTNSFAQNVRQLTSITKKIKNLTGLMSKIGIFGGGGSQKQEQAEAEARNAKILKDIQSSLLKKDLEELQTKVRAYKKYKEIRDDEIKARSRYFKAMKSQPEKIIRVSDLYPEAVEIAWEIVSILILLASILIACGASRMGKWLLLSTGAATLFFVFVNEMIELAQKGSL